MRERHPSCAVLLPLLSGREQLYKICYAACRRAIASGTGPFSHVSVLTLDLRKPKTDLSGAFNHAAQTAAQRGFSWLFPLHGNELLELAAFQHIARFMTSFDAIFGRSTKTYLSSSQNEAADGGSAAAKQRLADPLIAPHTGYLLRTSAALESPYQKPYASGGEMDRFFLLLKRFRAIRIEQPLASRIWDRSWDRPRSVTRQRRLNAVRQLLREYGPAWHVISQFLFMGQHFRFYISDPLDQIEKYHLGGLFWEEAELRFLAQRLRPAAVIVDIGAHVGNHAVFYSKLLAPRRIRLIEPNPTAIEQLKQNLSLNDVKAADCSKLGIGAGRRSGRATIAIPMPGNSGSACLSSTSSGNIPVAPLDKLLSDLKAVDLLKIDVESMELDVLHGARSVLKRCRPEILVEVKHENASAFLDLLADIGYSIIREFPTPLETNYYLAPRTNRAALV